MPSTSTRMIPVSRAISLYVSLIRLAGGDFGVTGAKPPFPACARATSASAAPATRTRTRARRLTGRAILWPMEERSRVELPAAVGDRYEVYVNGVRQEAGRDFDRIGNTLVFRRHLAREGRLGPVRWLSMLLGVAGTYRKHETVDVVYESGGRRSVATLEPTA